MGTHNKSWYLGAPLEVLYDIFMVNSDNYFRDAANSQNEVGTSMCLVIPSEMSLITFGLLKGTKAWPCLFGVKVRRHQVDY